MVNLLNIRGWQLGQRKLSGEGFLVSNENIMIFKSLLLSLVCKMESVLL